MHRVLRLSTGDLVRAFDGLRSDDSVAALAQEDDALVGVVVGSAECAPEPTLNVHAYPAVLPRDRYELVLRQLVEVGAASITPLVTERCVATIGDEWERRRPRWERILVEAAEQSERARVPLLREPAQLGRALASAAALGPVIVADPRHESAIPFSRLRERVGTPGTISLFVGPEGGFSRDEVGGALRAGARLAFAGRTVLRAETASPVLAALLLHALARDG